MINREYCKSVITTEINSSLKISSVKLPENVRPTISDRDFVIATVVSPTILVEPEKTEEAATAEGEVPVEGVAEEGVAGAEPKKEEGKEKTAKPADDKSKAAPADKAQAAGKEKETKKK